ncbi:MAG: nucleotidyl transferase AbiEii/AbiGii toxin family protein [Nanoarchaeota archaeon]|nr:nucleotidyl transferase AbiEii/AbiGii toxin family protein [DPANN group archaeon]MBL7116620.1 nucleotidyl transferase AbiEii/AbiGii toxin family protein [Nanoarchaeota archaeon]
MIPLSLRLKKARHKEIARTQDLMIEELYKQFNEAVLHGGTAIWRCYQGNRFSEDVDVYIKRDINRINNLFKNLEKAGFIVEKKKISENSIFSKLQFNRVTVRFEALFKTKKGFLKEYETIEGNFITVYTLTPEELIKEKVNAYLKRFKIRDIYDIFFLLRHVKDEDEVLKELKVLTKRFKQPIDKEDLKVLVIEGLVPDVKQMLMYINRWVK